MMQAGANYEVPKVKGMKAGKVCKTKVEVIADVTDHETCKAGCAKAAKANDKTKKGDSCCSLNYSSATAAGECLLGEGKETVDELESLHSAFILMTDAAFEEIKEESDGDSDSAKKLAASIAAIATTAMLSF